jgi:HAE1 family hydrophobic/amphiphilic exporter-1
MFLSNASVRRPVAVGCLIIALALLGLNAYRKFPLELLPKMDIPYITVMSIYPGATPSDIETDIARKIEDVVVEVDGLKHVTSSCMDNVCLTLLEFNLGVNVDVTAMDVREKLDKIMSELPAGVEKPIVLKYDVNAEPVATIGLTGDAGIDDLYDYADNALRDRLSVVRGVASVELIGGAKREVHVLLDRDAVAAANLSSMDVVRAVQDGILTLPVGRVRERRSEYGVRFDAEYSTVREIGDLQVAGRGGARRYIRDLGTVATASEERRQAAFVDGRPCIGIRVVKRSDANTVRVVEDVRKAVEEMRGRLPGGMDLVWVTDNGRFIEATVKSTSWNIVIGIALTAAILFFFLYNVRATVIVGITMPLTIVISLFFMHAMGLTLNVSTLMAIGLSVGLLVTNSIVVLESVVAHLAKGDSPWEAARRGTADVAVAVLGCAGTNVVVLLPIGMMGSLVGLFFKPFAWTTLIVNVVSILISFTLTPVLCALLLRNDLLSRGRLAEMERKWNVGLDYIADRLVALLRAGGERKWVCGVILAATAALFIQSLTLAPKVGFGFMSRMDHGEVFVKLEYPPRQGLARTTERVHEVEEALRGLPSVRHIFSQVGKVQGMTGKSSEGVHLAQLLVKFSDKTERSTSIEEILNQVRRIVRVHPDCIANVSIASPIGGEEIPVEIEIGGENLAQLDRIATTFQNIMTASLRGFTEVDTTVREGKPEIRILPNRPILADMNASVRGLGLMTRGNLEGLEAGTYRSGARTYDIRVKLAEEPGKSQIGEFLVPAGEDRIVTLNALATVVEGTSPVQITRVDKRRVSKVYSQLMPDLPLGTAMSRLNEAADAKGIIPAGYDYAFRGLSEYMSEAVAAFLEAAVLAVLLAYLALAAILESFKRPLLILATLPLALIGVLWFLFAAGESMTMFVLLGMVLLVGIVVNNAILILDRMQQLRNEGAEAREAMLQAVKVEFRAVTMVTLAAVLGMLPLATASGLGSELGVGMGIASVGGILVSALLTLITIPLLYILFAGRSG